MQYLVASLAIVLLLNFANDCEGKGESRSNVFKSLIGIAEKESDFENADDFESLLTFLSQSNKDEERKGKTSDKKDREVYLELRKFVSKEEVCNPYKIDEMIKYHKKYIKTKLNLQSSKLSLTKKFFTKYAIQVAFICKKNLIRNLELARAELKDRSKVFDEAKEKVYNDEPTIKMNIKLLEEQPNEPVSSNVKPRDDAQITLSEYREALTKLRRPEDILTFDRDDCIDSKYRETKVSSDKLQIFFKPALMCHELHRYYAGSLLSIAKLANYGYTAANEELDAQLSENLMVRDWIIAVQVCDPMLHLFTKENNGDWAIVDTCSPKVPAIEPIVFDDKIERLDNELLEEMIPKSKATRHRAQNLMKSALKKMAKADLMKQLRTGTKIKSIFSRSLAMLTKKDSNSRTMSDVSRRKIPRFFVQLDGNALSMKGLNEPIQPKMSEKELNSLMMQVMEGKQSSALDESESNGTDGAVSFFDPMSMLVTTLSVLLIMLTFEWLFFIVMTLAARVCHQLYFNFDNLLTFPPKFLSWADADFARFNDEVEKIDEDDFFDYDQLSPDEQHQRVLLQRVFGKPPPMMYRE